MAYSLSSTSEFLKELLLSPYDAGIIIKHLEGSPLFKQLIGTARALTALKQQQLEEITLRNQLAAQLEQQLKDLAGLKQELSSATENYQGDSEDEERQLAELRQQQEEQAKRTKELQTLLEETSISIAALQLQLTKQENALKETLTGYGTALTTANKTLFDNLAKTFEGDTGMIAAINTLRLKPTRTPQERKQLLLKDLENPELPLTQELKDTKERIQQLDNKQVPVFDTAMTELEVAAFYAKENGISVLAAVKALKPKTEKAFEETVEDKQKQSGLFETTISNINNQITETKAKLDHVMKQSEDLMAKFATLQQQNSSLFDRAKTWTQQAATSLGNTANRASAAVGNVINPSEAQQTTNPGPQLTKQPVR